MFLDSIKCVIFDIGGVLIDLDLDRCISTFESLGFERARDMVSCYHPADFFGALERGEISNEEFYQKIREESGLPIDDEEVARAYRSILVEIPIYKLQLLRRVREAGFEVCALSNISSVLMPRVRELFMADGASMESYFDHMFLSFEMGVMKPSSEIYERVIGDLGLSPSQILFIDDGAKNIEAAREMGMQVYLASSKEDFSHIFE